MANGWPALNGNDGCSLSSGPQEPLSSLFLTTSFSFIRGLKWKAMSPPCCSYLRFTANLKTISRLVCSAKRKLELPESRLIHLYLVEKAHIFAIKLLGLCICCVKNPVN